MLKTASGDVKTPCFFPDATRGAIKHLSAEELEALGLSGLVANTFHLHLRPGEKFINRAGGLHKFMNWPKPILTDSGGYQIFSLIHKKTGGGAIDNSGAVFKSPLDGSRHKLTPEQSIKIQFKLGSDMIVCLDDCPANDSAAEKLKAAVDRTIVWAKRCRREYNKQLNLKRLSGGRPLLFAVAQGADNFELRRHCANELIKIGFDGFGFGARHLDQSGDFLEQTLEYTARLLPENKPRFGLGIGSPEDIIRSIALGWDMFDCVIPTREGRHGRLFFGKKTASGNFLVSVKNANKFYSAVNITNAKFSKDFSPINSASRLKILREYSKAYLNYLFKIGEPLAARLASLNNLEFYLKIMRDSRELIKTNKL